MCKQNEDLLLPTTMQEATPEESADDETMISLAHVDTHDGEAADLQLIMETHTTGPSLSPTIESRPQNNKTLLAHSSSSVSSEKEGLKSRHRVAVVIPQQLRPRRSQSRPSYVEQAMDDSSSDKARNSSSGGEDDVWDPSDSETNTESNEDEGSGITLSSSSVDENCGDSGPDSIEPEPVIASRRKSRVNLTSNPKQGKGVDLSLPPLDNIQDIIAAMATQAIELGLRSALEKLKGRPINVATMCSGTESPILFLRMLDEALHSKGLRSLPIKHHFSAEIDPTKQAFIERNFHPPILFRDVRQLGDDNANTATTAYGAEELIPRFLDILIAGFVCKDLSVLNSKRKTVDDEGETGDTWRAIYGYSKRFRPSIVLLENVRSDKKVWDDVVSRWAKIGYEAAWIYCDTKNYYIPHTRERMYMIAINREVYGKNASNIVAEWQSTMETLRRQCSSPYEDFLTELPATLVTHSTMLSESDWSLCKLRYDQIRSDQGLGTRRPITQWSESGTLHPPDHANRKWYKSQSSRVYDAIDVAHLQAAKEGYDSMYKMKIWDVSQNVDRFKTGLGIVPCITPGGCDFSSNRQDALNGSQTLLLQGMPLDKLHFAGETQRECQDLAGNAMTTTVIGASLISAIIHGYEAFQACLPANNEVSGSQMSFQNQIRFVQASAMEKHEYHQAAPSSLDIQRLLTEARLTSRLCACEGDQHISEEIIKICSGCGHTACARCASNPRHQYADSVPRNVRYQNPSAFIKAWRPQLPSRLTFSNFPSLRQRLSKNEAYLQRILEVNIGSQQFCLSEFLRCDNEWTIVYAGNDARVVLSIGIQTQWLLYVDCPRELPGNSGLRKAFATPVARAGVLESLLGSTWELFIPSGQVSSLQVCGYEGRSKSWRNSLGLLSHQTGTVPTRIYIQGNNEETGALEGEYTHLAHCGTAEASLYKRSSEPTLYLFLDPDPIGDWREDRFVFSTDCKRKRPGDSRAIDARVSSSWRPWHISDAKARSLAVTHAGSWETIPMHLNTSLLAPTASVLKSGSSLTGSEVDCSSTMTILDVHIPEKLPIDQFSDYSWALDQVRTAPQLQEWHLFDLQSPLGCICTPSYPAILWNVDGAGRATPQEDRKAAATFERGIKTRCPIFDVLTNTGESQTQIKVAINVASLVHRAKGRLSRLVDSTESIENGWRLLTDHVAMSSERLPAFRLRSNAGDAPYSGPLGLKHELRGAQPRALAWMRAQETGVELQLTEIEEAVHPALGWRAEARAQTEIKIRGGVLADLPSFGKTVTTIALIQSEFEQSSPQEILRQNRSATNKMPQLIDTAATLIVCPPHIAMQWQTELELFLGSKQYDEYGVCIIRDFTELKKLTIDDMQQSRIVVVSWSVLSDDAYISELASMAAMPEPADSSCRAFSAWLDGVHETLPAQISRFQSMDLTDFKQTTRDLLVHRLQQPAYKAALPLRVKHGSNYQSYEATRATERKKGGKSQPTLKQKSLGFSKGIIPIFQMFRFNRIVVDEFHYLNDPKKMKNIFAAISVKKMSGEKRWIVSGTPPLNNFTDIDNIASFLGARLGRFAVEAAKSTAFEEFLLNDQTAVERFLSKTEVMTPQWHKARHEQAQQFLDLFVRQNKASLEYIACQEELRTVNLDVAHHAVYLELSQHLISQQMQVRRLQNKADSDRAKRLNASLNDSRTAEDALLKAALLYETRREESGLDTLVRKRLEQRKEAEAEVLRPMRAFEWHKAKGFKDLKPTDPKKAVMEENTVPKLYDSFARDIQRDAWLGDSEATTKVRNLLKTAHGNPSNKGLQELERISKDKMIKVAKAAMSNLRQSCVELTLRWRSERFIDTVQQLLQLLTEESGASIACDAEECQGKASISEMYLTSQCGHLTCWSCIQARGDDENCVVRGCSCTVQSINFIKATDLDFERENTAMHSFGRKTDSIVKLIKRLPGKDQGLVFAPNDETIEALGAALDHHNIPYCTPSGCSSRKATKTIEEFKASAHEDVKCRPVVLLLNLTSETAAGVNLTNANHIIFISPLLVETQYKYDSAMTQAIARSRRYGQEKRVHIYHFAALRTIDVDILEHRHKRASGITAAASNMSMPPALQAREKTRLVKTKHDSVALVPISWLADDECRKQLGIEREPERYTSLINFSETFQDEEE